MQKIIEDNPATLKEIAGLRVKNSIQTYMLRKRGTEGDKEHGGGGGGGGASYYEEGEDGVSSLPAQRLPAMNYCFTPMAASPLGIAAGPGVPH